MLTSLVDYSTLFSLNWDYISEQGKVLNTAQLLDITTQVLLSTFTNDSGLHALRLDLLRASSQHLLQVDRPEDVTKYKLVIPIQGIMIFVFREISYKMFGGRLQ